MVLSEHMTGHRCSVLEANSALLFHRILKSGSAQTRRKKFAKKKTRPGFPYGILSTWQNRAKLGVAKLAKRLTASTQSSEFPELVLKPGSSGLDDEFIEVQVFGDMTVRTFESVTLSGKASKPVTGKRQRHRKRRGSTSERAVRDLCKTYNVPCEIV